VDTYGESEQVTGFYTMMENSLRLPFETEILGMTVTVESIDIAEDDQLVAVCRKDKTKQRISLSEPPLPCRFPREPSGSLRIDIGERARFDEHKSPKTHGGAASSAGTPVYLGTCERQ